MSIPSFRYSLKFVPKKIATYEPPSPKRGYIFRGILPDLIESKPTNGSIIPKPSPRTEPVPDPTEPDSADNDFFLGDLLPGLTEVEPFNDSIRPKSPPFRRQVWDDERQKYNARREILAKAPVPQPDCPFFSVMPAEIREIIFEYALAAYPSTKPERQYRDRELYYRPEVVAPPVQENALLRSCRLIYAENWFKPFLLRDHTHWVTSRLYAPPGYRDEGDDPGMGFYQWEDEYRWQMGADAELPEFRHLHVFAQMYKLEGNHLAKLLAKPAVRPREITLTIRHIDWWWWENDHPLRIQGEWITRINAVLPSCVHTFWLELETIHRKREQLDNLAEQIRTQWYFRRAAYDGEALFPDASGHSVEVRRRTGSSIYQSTRWVRDEVAPKQLEYHILRIPFRPRHAVLHAGGQVDEGLIQKADRDGLDPEAPFLKADAATVRPTTPGPVNFMVDSDGEMYDDEDDDEDSDGSQDSEEDEDEDSGEGECEDSEEGEDQDSIH